MTQEEMKETTPHTDREPRTLRQQRPGPQPLSAHDGAHVAGAREADAHAHSARLRRLRAAGARRKNLAAGARGPGILV